MVPSTSTSSSSSASSQGVDAFLASLQPSIAPSASSDSQPGESANSTDLLLRALQVGGGVGVSGEATMDDIVSGVSLVYIKSSDLVCGGAIGSSGCGCVTLKDTCPVKLHGVKRGKWPSEPALFLMNKGKDAAVYLEPYLPTSLLKSEEELTALLQEAFTLESWSEKVGLYEFANSTGVDIAKAGAEIKAVKDGLKTPAPKGGTKRQVDFDTATVQLDLASKKIVTDGSLIQSMETRIQALMALCKDMKTDPTTSDLLPFIAMVAEHSQGLAEKDELRHEYAKQTSDYVKAELASLNTLAGALNVDVKELRTLIGTRFDSGTFGGNIFEMLSQIDTILGTSGVVELVRNNSCVVSQALLQAAIMPYKTAIEALDDKLNKAINGTTGGFSGHGMGAGFQLHTAPSIPKAPQAAVTARDTSWENSMEKKIEALTRQINGSKNAGDTGVNFRNFSFSNRRDFGTWLSNNEGKTNISLSLFQCHVTILHRIFTALLGSHRDLREAKAMSDMKVRDYDVNAAQALHTSGLPKLWRGNSKSGGMFTGPNTGGQKHRFEGCSSYEKYGDPSNPDGLRYRALEAWEEVYRTIQIDIENDIGNPTVKNLANLMLARSDKFVRDLFTFMTDTYLEYLGSFGDTAKTWDFVCQCVEKILTSEFQEARSLATGMDFSDPEFNLKMIWCSLRIVAVQEKFLEVGIANHSVLSSTVSRYLIKNTNAGNVDALRDRVTSHTSSIAALEATIADLETRVRSATSLADKANATLKKLKEDKGKKN